MAEREDFLLAIRDDWTNLELRLVFSDWLEENGEMEEALRQRNWKKTQEASKKWIERFADDHIGESYDEIMQTAKDFIETGATLSTGSRWLEEDFGEFWPHFEVMTGQSPPDKSSPYEYDRDMDECGHCN